MLGSRMHGLYAIIDIESLDRRGIPPLAFAEAVLRGGPAAIQVRDKKRAPRDALPTLIAIAERTRAQGILCFGNDRADLAKAAGCDGVHLGQDDAPPSVARALGLAVGISTHDERQLIDAAGLDVDYVAIGPVFATASKHNPDPVLGADRLAGLAAGFRSLTQKPLVGIGGIDRERARVLRGSLSAVAVIGDLQSALDTSPGMDAVTERVRAYRSLWEGGDAG